MSKRHRSDDDGGELESRRPHSRHRRRRRRRHLYVVLDDWSKGYSVYKVDVDGFDGDPDADLDDEAVRLPEPPVFRLETADYGRFGIFVAVGSRIFATHYSEDTNARAPVLMFDTVTGGLAVCPGVPAELCNQPMIFPAGDKVYAMGRSKIKMDARGESRKYLEELAADGEGSWAWSSSVDDRAPPPPFDAYYDGELDAWVGLWSGHSGRRGRVCSCDVVDPRGGGGGEQPPPAWKLAVRSHPAWRARSRFLSVALARMGGGEFCVVEWRSRRGVSEEELHERCLLYATTFRLRYDRDGSLEATDRRARAFTARKKSDEFEWCAFGI
ncbi:hypothetical protein OsJ_09881 [Oryza sativa Japonica Group]|uniref:DUF1618 domain-containing protein n=1 Tax=Oryza sativa subsp. japonica TaxID=39947 RepID=B9F651_ORYSJ|nr:hypothetical protein OsJ_09881 [Oryza sativa Japonica Group]